MYACIKGYIINSLMNEAERLMKNYGDRGGCYQADNTLQDLQNSS